MAVNLKKDILSADIQLWQNSCPRGINALRKQCVKEDILEESHRLHYTFMILIVKSLKKILSIDAWCRLGL